MNSARYHNMLSLSRLRSYLRPALLPGVTVALVLLANTGTSQAGHWELDHYVRSLSRRTDHQGYGAPLYYGYQAHGYHRELEPADGSGIRNEVVTRNSQGQMPSMSTEAQVSCSQTEHYGGLVSPPYHYQVGRGFCEMTVHAVFKWHRNQIYYGGGEAAVDDPNDNPPPRLYLRERGVSRCTTMHSNAAEWPDTINSVEHPYMGQGFTVENLRNGLGDAAQELPRPIYYGSTTADYSSYVQGADATHFTVLVVGSSDTVNGPTRTLGGTITSQPWTFTNNKEHTYGWLSFWYDAQGFTLVLNDPDADGVALPEYPPVIHEKKLNQYVIPSSNDITPVLLRIITPFLIPCTTRIAYTGQQLYDLNDFTKRLDWELQRPLVPMPLLRRGENGFTGGDAFPMCEAYPEGMLELPPATPPPATASIRGLGYYTAVPLPSSNSSFGLNQVKLKLDGHVIATAPIAVFYASTESTHPPGDPAGENVMGIPIDTPNWIYYYNQAWPSPVPIIYHTGNRSFFRHSDPGHIYIADPAHGASYGPRPLFQTRANLPNGGVALTWVGFYQAYGLDVYARVVTHELKHKEIWDSFHESIDLAAHNDIPDDAVGPDGKMLDGDADRDGDGLPNWYEEAIGLATWDSDTTGFAREWGYPHLKGDGEAVARAAEVSILSDRNKDWASDGLNIGHVPGQDPAQRIRLFGPDRITPLQ